VIYLLDSDTLIFIIRGMKAAAGTVKREAAEKLIARSQEAMKVGDAVGLSAVTVAELEFGARRSGNYDEEMTAVRLILTPFELYPLDVVVCPVHYGRIRDDLERAGEVIGAMDLLIAAHALALDATLVTNNLKHFTRVSSLRAVTWL
jgi:tRNA(fMet)-specific endonuclease VapC